MNHKFLSIYSIIPDITAIYNISDETTNFVSEVREIASHNPEHYSYISDFKDKCLKEIELNSSDEEKIYYMYMFSILTDDLFECLYYDESKRPYYLYGLKCFLRELPLYDKRISKRPTKFQKAWLDLALNQLKSELKKESNFFKIGRYITQIADYIKRHDIAMVYDDLVEMVDEFVDEVVDEESIEQDVFKTMMANYIETYCRFISNFTNVWKTYRYRQEFIREDLYNHSEVHSNCALANNQDGLLSPLSYKNEMAYFLNNCLNYVSDNISTCGLPLLPFIFARTRDPLETSNVNNYLVNLEYMYFMDDNYQFTKSLPINNCIALSRDYYKKTLNFTLMSDEVITSVPTLDGFEFELDYDDRIIIDIHSYVLLNVLNDDKTNHFEKALMVLKEFRLTDDHDEFFMTRDIIDFNEYINHLNQRCVKMNDENDEDKKFDELPFYDGYNRNGIIISHVTPLHDNFLLDVY